MNESNAKDYLPLVQALAGGRLQKLSATGHWDDCPDCIFDSPPTYFRIKPEPREWWVTICPPAIYSIESWHTSKQSAEAFIYGKQLEIVRVREVLP